jgi:hypothetical protein
MFCLSMGTCYTPPYPSPKGKLPYWEVPCNGTHYIDFITNYTCTSDTGVLISP